tara:strand:+ start:16353 stop:16706 length:354 start_codon:yes stop_codon:yes gene_type:complete
VAEETQRVSIRYSVDLAEVPTRVKIMLVELAQACGGLSKSIRETGNMAEEDPHTCNQRMTKLISVLEKMIVRVEDCLEISNGFLQLTEEPEEEPQPSGSGDSPPVTPYKQVTTLVRK